MKAVITILCFIAFLLIRSGNSHAVLNESDRPAISFMYQHNEANLKDKITSLTSHIDPLIAGCVHDENPVIEEFNSENFQLTRDLHTASDFVALLLCAVVLFIFVFRFAKKIPFCNFVAYLYLQRYVLQQNWRI
ncbi:hypothetical protein [Sphingobacterium sp. HMA12]|uniref:hypothetical protein n=1 Tax=Sphingobacterium sp. HMA12 TaxID=2050894 RepID=UPI000CE9F75D|nr:hypothetical protein [Sphingobacterium sp. HMA12]